MTETQIKKSILKSKIQSHIKDLAIIGLVLIIFVWFLSYNESITGEGYAYSFIIVLLVIGLYYYKRKKEIDFSLGNVMNNLESQYEQFHGTASFLPNLKGIEASSNGDNYSLYDKHSNQLFQFRGTNLVGKYNQDFKTRERELFDRSTQISRELEVAKFEERERIMKEVLEGEEE